MTYCNAGAGTVTLTPASGTIGETTNYVLQGGTELARSCIGIYSGTFSGAAGAFVANDWGLINGPIVVLPNPLPSYFNTVSTQTGTTYTFASTDCGTEVVFTSASAITATIPIALTTGCRIKVLQAGAGKVSVNGTAVSPATLHTHVASSAATGTGGQYAEIDVDIYVTGTAILTGDGS